MTPPGTKGQVQNVELCTEQLIQFLYKSIAQI